MKITHIPETSKVIVGQGGKFVLELNILEMKVLAIVLGSSTLDRFAEDRKNSLFYDDKRINKNAIYSLYASIDGVLRP